MMDSVLVARDRWLKPGGALYPSHATLFMAPMYDFTQERRDMERRQASVSALSASSPDLTLALCPHFPPPLPI
jgi:hypothetical protein